MVVLAPHVRVDQCAAGRCFRDWSDQPRHCGDTPQTTAVPSPSPACRRLLHAVLPCGCCHLYPVWLPRHVDRHLRQRPHRAGGPQGHRPCLHGRCALRVLCTPRSLAAAQQGAAVQGACAALGQLWGVELCMPTHAEPCTWLPLATIWRHHAPAALLSQRCHQDAPSSPIRASAALEHAHPPLHAPNPQPSAPAP